jgi:glucose/arabinose dehydrogenase
MQVNHGLVAPALAAASAVLWSSPAALAGGTPLATERIAADLAHPVFATHAPGDFTRLFIVEKQGRIRILNMKTGAIQPVASAFLDIDALVGGGTTTNNEQGLLGVAFHDDYQSNGLFYVHYTNTSGDTVVARYTRASADAADPMSAFVVRTVDQPQGNHNGGWIGFGPNDGYLYIALGDGGNLCDTGAGHVAGGNGQDITSNLLGKILRLDIDDDDFPADAARNYAIPPDNPFVGVAGDDEIWVYGLRNPWRDSFDRATGDLYIGDVGQGAREEVTWLPAASGGGKNLGWPCKEGNGCASESGCTTALCACGGAALTDPIHDYLHNPPPDPAAFVCAVTGGYVYRGCAVPDLDGHYFFSDFCGGAIWSFIVDAGAVTNFTDRTGEMTPSLDAFTVDQVVSFGEDARGEVYIVDQGDGADGQVFRIRAAAYAVPFADIVCDLTINVSDLLALLAAWGPCDGCAADIDGDHTVGVSDLLNLLANWGPVAP